MPTQNKRDNNNSLVDTLLTEPSHPLARVFSFLLGVGLSVFILFFPQWIARDSTELDHTLLSLVMLAMCGCFVHGLGFKPYNIVAKLIFSPLLCWPISAMAFWMWAA